MKRFSGAWFSLVISCLFFLCLEGNVAAAQKAAGGNDCGGADINASGRVGTDDLILVIVNWHTTDGVYDINGDNFVNGVELGLVIEWYGCEEDANPEGVEISGELKTWHKVTLTFDGPATSEDAQANPFRDYRLEVLFSNGSTSYLVPGYYAADGNAAETSAASGSKWRVHFVPDDVGTWSFAASFRSGEDVALSEDPLAGQADAFSGTTGTFNVTATDKTGSDFRGKGKLRYVGERYLQFAGSGEYFLKGGADSPENFLAYFEFDNTYDTGGIPVNSLPDGLHHYEPHLGDWQPGDPTWQGDKGKAIIGSLNYLASVKINSLYFLTQNIEGDGQEVFPWTSHTVRDRFDVSKLAQWEIVFEHMDKLGIMLHVVHQEQENDQLLDGGALGVERKLYYRELIARFSHHLAITWNLGEENSNTGEQRKAYSEFIKAHDAYQNHIVIHTFANSKEGVYCPLLGLTDECNADPDEEPWPFHDGASLQDANNQTVITWLDRSQDEGRPWVVSFDEQHGWGVDIAVPDNQDDCHNRPRKEVLWGALMAGGGGVEWYNVGGDLGTENFRVLDSMWNQTRHALEFFKQYLPFHEMQHANQLTSRSDDFCLAKAGEIYAVFLKDSGDTTQLDLGNSNDTFSVEWYHPRTGSGLYTGSVSTISGPGSKAIGLPPSISFPSCNYGGNAADSGDWAALIRKQ